MNAQMSPSPTDTIYSNELKEPKFIFRAHLAVVFLPFLAFAACLVFNIQDVVPLPILPAFTFGAFWGMRTLANCKLLQWTNTWRRYESEVMDIEINASLQRAGVPERAIPGPGKASLARPNPPAVTVVMGRFLFVF